MKDTGFTRVTVRNKTLDKQEIYIPTSRIVMLEPHMYGEHKVHLTPEHIQELNKELGYSINEEFIILEKEDI